MKRITTQYIPLAKPAVIFFEDDCALFSKIGTLVMIKYDTSEREDPEIRTIPVDEEGNPLDFLGPVCTTIAETGDTLSTSEARFQRCVGLYTDGNGDLKEKYEHTVKFFEKNGIKVVKASHLSPVKVSLNLSIPRNGDFVINPMPDSELAIEGRYSPGYNPNTIAEDLINTIATAIGVIYSNVNERFAAIDLYCEYGDRQKKLAVDKTYSDVLDALEELAGIIAGMKPSAEN